MITAFVVVDKAVQIVLTPETEIDKMVIEFIKEHKNPIFHEGFFYKNDAGYYAEKRMIVEKDRIHLILRWEAPESSIQKVDHLSSTMDSIKHSQDPTEP